MRGALAMTSSMTIFEDGTTNNCGHRGLPEHVAIIMDGNGRWAAARGLVRLEGHRRGIESVRQAVRYACEVGISYLTLYSFSSENWRRPVSEVSELMQLLRFFIRSDLAELKREGVQIRVIGAEQGVAPDILALLRDAEEQTRDNERLVLTIAFNYGSRDEITRAMQRIAAKVDEGSLKPDEITEQHIDDHLDTRGVPDPDLLIRTSGEMRLSNFLLWQCAYSELVFMDACWPDFNADLFAKALAEYQNRERRFGGLQERTAG
jgi:undecaprenyl diphosphate synthase